MRTRACACVCVCVCVRKSYLGEIHSLLDGSQIHDSARCAYDNVWHLGLEGVHVILDVYTTVKDARLDLGEVLAEALVLALNLEGKLASVAKHNDVDLARDRS